MKKWFLFCLAIVGVIVFAACSGNAEEVGGIRDDGTLWGELSIMSFMNDPMALGVYFTEYHPDVEINFIMTGMEGGAYQTALQQILSAGANVPDIVMLDAGFVRQFVESPFLMDISHLLPAANALEIYQFTLDAGMEAGQLRAISHQAAPGVMYYRRSLAQRYFGTDDPAVIQNYFRDMDAMIESAQRIREISNGETFTISSHIELSNLFFANRSTPWIVNNRLMHDDPVLAQYLDVARVFRDSGLEAEIGTWSGEWHAGMNDTMVDAHGNPRQIFSYFLPTWGIFILMPNAGDTDGDWAAIPGPLPYHWGGAWFAIPVDAPNPEVAKAFLEFVFTEDVMTKWATGYFSNERLRQIDPSLAEVFGLAAGDFLSSARVVRNTSAAMVGTDTYYFLGGQNPHDVFALAAPNVSLENLQASDFIMNAAFTEAVTQYLEDNLTREQAMQSFIDSALIGLPAGITPN
ncbi:MAG: extracellular solute-binding protein [Defluviitaleaceae bacterium]|nr:extracellular solute-binding protein [Defluviitaleaceae bacterium]